MLICHIGSIYSLGLGDSLVDISREEEVLSTGTLDDLVESGLVDREVVRVPRVNTGLVEVDNGDLDVGALGRNDSAGGATDVAGTDWMLAAVLLTRRVGGGRAPCVGAVRGVENSLQQIFFTWMGAMVGRTGRERE